MDPNLFDGNQEENAPDIYSLTYRQEFFDRGNGFFENNMKLGQCFDVTYFDANTNA